MVLKSLQKLPRKLVQLFCAHCHLAHLFLMPAVLLLFCPQVRCPGTWDHITNQIGMFSYTGLTKVQCQNMTNKWHVYMTMDGRCGPDGWVLGLSVCV
jgi:hypothetical protein